MALRLFSRKTPPPSRSPGGAPGAILSVALPGGSRVVAGGILEIQISAVGVLSQTDLECMIGIRDRDRRVIYETTLSALGLPRLTLRHGAQFNTRLELPVLLSPGEYRLSVVLVNTLPGETESAPCAAEQGFTVTATAGPPRFHGLVDLGARIAPERPDPENSRRLAALARDWSGQVPSRLEIGAPDNPYLLNGFYNAESSGKESFRWTTGDCELQLRLEGDALRLRTIAAPPDVHRQPLTVSLEVDGESLGSRQLAEPVAQLRYDIPARLVGRVVSVRLVIQPDWRPADKYAGNADQRRLGIALATIQSGK